MAKLTLIGMYNYDKTIFDGLTLPDGIEKDLAIDQILFRSGEFEVLYPNPDFMKFAVNRWSKTHYRTFEKWIRALDIKYDPLNNYDRTEETRDDYKGDYSSRTEADYNNDRTVSLEDKRTADLQDKRTADLQDKRTADLEDKRTANLEDRRTTNLEDRRTADLTTERTDNLTDERTANLQDKVSHNTTVTTTQTVNGTTQHDVSAYDSGDLVPAWKDTTNAGANNVVTTGDETTNTTGTDTMKHTGTATTKETGTDTMKHTGTDTTVHTGTDTTKTTGTDTMLHTGTDTTKTTGTDTMKHTGTDKNNIKGTLSDVGGNEGHLNVHTSKVSGNIGVTTSQQMLQAELDVQRFNIYEEIADLFIDEFCILVYV